MKKFKNVLSLLFTLSTLLSSGQGTLFQSWKAPDNTIVNKVQSVPGTGTFDTKINGPLPTDAVPATIGSQVRYKTTLAPFATFNWEQFGTNPKYYSDNFKFALDANGRTSIDARRNMGMNMFNKFTVDAAYNQFGTDATIDWRSQLREGEGMLYCTQNVLGKFSDNPTFFITPLDQFIREAYGLIPALGYGDWAKYKFFVWNLETNAFNNYPGQKGAGALPGFDTEGYFTNWSSEKNTQIKMESTGEVVTLEQLSGRGQSWWSLEMATRRASKLAAVCEMARDKANPLSNVKVSIGHTAWTFYFPAIDARNSSESFFPGNSNLTHIGGDAAGNITITGIPGKGTWTVNLSGDGLKHSDYIMGYHYELYPQDFRYGPGAQDYNNIFVNKTSGVQTQAEIWAKIPMGNSSVSHIAAIEKGFIQLNREIISRRTGLPKQPYVLMKEVIYESSDYVLPFARVQNIIRYNDPGYRETPRLQVMPLTHAAGYKIVRFFAGDEPGWGYYLFPVDQIGCVMDPKYKDNYEQKIYYNFDLETETALLAARNEMQPYEFWFKGSTFVEDPMVQINQTGSYSSYNGYEALNYNSGGSFGPSKPVYMGRYKQNSDGSYRVVILGGMWQNYNQNRTDNIQLQGLPGNLTFAINLRGPSTQVFDFIVPAGSTNKTFTTLNGPAPQYEKAGWNSWVNPVSNN